MSCGGPIPHRPHCLIKPDLSARHADPDSRWSRALCMQWAKLMLSLKVKPDAEEMCDEKQTATVKVSDWEGSDLH